jgi:hypothetical protein
VGTSWLRNREISISRNACKVLGNMALIGDVF